MKLSDQQKAFALDVARLIKYIFDEGYACTLGDAFRSPEQAVINAQKGTGIINSLHCQRIAIDLNIFSPSGEYLSMTEDYRKFGEYWESLYGQNRWGGRFSGRPDGNHFERKV